MVDSVRVGSVLHGFTGGYFGRDSYDCKRVEALGADWVVVRYENGVPDFAAVNPEVLAEYMTDATCWNHGGDETDGT